jgi:hypothetical protein
MTAATFQKGDRVAFKEFPEVAAGKIVELWTRGFYKVTRHLGKTNSIWQHRSDRWYTQQGRSDDHVAS